MRTTVAAVGAALALLCLAGCGSSPSPSPMTVPAPPAVPTARLEQGGCWVTYDSIAGAPAHGLVAFDQHPLGGVAVWFPDRNDQSERTCRVRSVGIDRGAAIELADAVDRAPAFAPDGPVNCPAGIGPQTRIVLTYPHAHYEIADVGITGCAEVYELGRRPRIETDAVHRLLGRLAPAGQPIASW